MDHEKKHQGTSGYLVWLEHYSFQNRINHQEGRQVAKDDPSGRQKHLHETW